MVLDNAFKILSTPKYLLIWGISTALVMWIYMGVLTNHAMYDTMGWIFALAFPPLAAESSRHNGTTWLSARLAR